MAIYTPTDCSPFNGVFDLHNDLPITIECKIDTSNTIIRGYSIEIYNSNNERIFPTSDIESGPIANRISYVSDLKKYVKEKYPSIANSSTNINSGLNGSYLEIPFYVDGDEAADTTVRRNQMTDGLISGQTYSWKITLYQEIAEGSFPPNAEKYYDMTVTSGTVIGSYEERIQTALVEDDNQVISNLVLIDKYVQPVVIPGLISTPSSANYNAVKWTRNTGSIETEIEFSTKTRSLITNYDSTYGYVYPSTASGSGFEEGQITASVSNGFQIYKNGNNPENLTATDMIYFVYDKPETKLAGDVEWVTTPADLSTSYWKQTYSSITESSGNYKPFADGSGFENYTLSGGERIIFNNVSEGAYKTGSIYYGSPYNGIFTPSFEEEEVKDDNGNITSYTVNVRWNRTTDATTWGTLLTKSVYVQTGNHGGQNMEISTNTTAGIINQTPFKFVNEKPVRLFKTAELEKNSGKVIAIDNGYLFSVYSGISSLTSVVLKRKNSDESYTEENILKNCIFEVGKRDIIFTTTDPVNIKDDLINVEFTPYIEQDYTGLIFYNKQSSANTKGVVYVRPSINIDKNMVFKELTTTLNYTWFNIADFNSRYNYILYGGDTTNKYGNFNPTINKTRYQIKSFYKNSDYNPFSIYEDPEITVTATTDYTDLVLIPNDVENKIDGRDFLVVANYEQNDYILWKSYQWILYNYDKTAALEKTEETFNGEISAKFYGLDPGNSYYLVLIIQTNAGKTIEKYYLLVTDFTEGESTEEVFEVSYDCDTLSMKCLVIYKGNTNLAPEADEYLTSGTTATNNTTFYYDNSTDMYKTKLSDGTQITTASIENDQLKVISGTELKYNDVFNTYNVADPGTERAAIDVNTTNADEIVLEGSFTFTDEYNGNAFAVEDEDSETKIEISFPYPLEVDAVEPKYSNLAADINKVKLTNGSKTAYLNIVKEDGTTVNIWQSIHDDFCNVSNRQPSGYTTHGDRTNVAKFKFAQVSENGTIKKDSYINIRGSVNSFSDTAPIKNIIKDNTGEIGFLTSDGGNFLTVDSEPFISGCCPDRMVWTAYIPETEQKDVVISKNSDGTIITQKQSVLSTKVLRWPTKNSDESKITWKDGCYLLNGTGLSTTTGKVIWYSSMLGQTVIGEEKITATETPTYSNRGVEPLLTYDNYIAERAEIVNYTFLYKLYINTADFSVNTTKSYCFVKYTPPNTMYSNLVFD